MIRLNQMSFQKGVNEAKHLDPNYAVILLCTAHLNRENLRFANAPCF